MNEDDAAVAAWILCMKPDLELDRWRAEFQRLLAKGYSREAANEELVRRINAGEKAGSPN